MIVTPNPLTWRVFLCLAERTAKFEGDALLAIDKTGSVL